MTPDNASAFISALSWHRDIGADSVLDEAPQNHLTFKQRPDVSLVAAPTPAKSMKSVVAAPLIMGSGALKDEAVKIAAAAQTLEALKTAIESFEGVEAKKTATQIVFADGNQKATVMIIGEAPGADEDRTGKPFAGVTGQLLDKALGFIGLSRAENVYISNIINWRPPGNRTPTPAEVEISLPFIRRHIELVKPRIILLAGGVATKALLGTSDGITKLRGQQHIYKCDDGTEIPVMATYHPSYLLRTPSKKAEAWADFLALKTLLKQPLSH